MRCPGAAKLSLIEWNAFRRRPVIASVMLRRLEDEKYLMRLKNGHSFRLLDITSFAA
jgi:hypothetical protein